MQLRLDGTPVSDFTDLLYELRDQFTDHYSVEIINGRMKVSKGRYEKSFSGFLSFHLERLQEIAREHNATLILKPNKSSFTLIPTYPVERSYEFKENLVEAVEFAEKVAEKVKNLHAFDVMLSLSERVKDSERFKELAEKELEERYNLTFNSAVEFHVALQKLRMLTWPYTYKIHYLVQMLRVPLYEVIVDRREFYVDDLLFAFSSSRRSYRFYPFGFKLLIQYF